MEEDFLSDSSICIEGYFPPAAACQPEYCDEFDKDMNYTYDPYNLYDSNSNPITSSSSLTFKDQSDILSSMNIPFFPPIKRRSVLNNDLKEIGEENTNIDDSTTGNFLKVSLVLLEDTTKPIYSIPWTEMECKENRRIVRFTKSLIGLDKLLLDFSIVNIENLQHDERGIDPDLGLPYIEISCLRCQFYDKHSNKLTYKYYITSIEIIKLIEFLVGTYDDDEAAEDHGSIRRERGRIRSNLFPFWAKWTVNTKIDDHNLNKLNNDINEKFKLDLGNRIMNYKTRKPRDSFKEIRVLNWDKLNPALQRVFQNYYIHHPLSTL